MFIPKFDHVNEMNIEDRAAISNLGAHWGNTDRLTKEETIALAQRKDAGDIEARNELVTRNLQLVHRIARGWTGRGVPLEDLIQEGAIGLMRAADLYDWTLGNEFSTYATPRVIQACQRAVENMANEIRIPAHVRHSGRPAPQEWAERAKHVISGNKTISRHAGEAGRAGNRINGNIELFDLVPSDDDTASQATNRALAQAALDVLTDDRERMVVELFYLGDVDLLTIAGRLGVTKQRVEQIKKRAVARMREALVGVEA